METKANVCLLLYLRKIKHYCLCSLQKQGHEFKEANKWGGSRVGGREQHQVPQVWGSWEAAQKDWKKWQTVQEEDAREEAQPA